jgi:hypothetical protein
MLDDMDDREHPPTDRAHALNNRARVRLPDTAPSTVFDVVCDLDRLPHWNAAIDRVMNPPSALTPGAEWKVAMQDGALSWISKSTVVEYDPVSMVFVYRSGTDDGNPSYAEWRWSTIADGRDTILEVSWKLCPRTLLRRWVLAPYRARRLRKEVPASLVDLVRHVGAAPGQLVGAS